MSRAARFIVQGGLLISLGVLAMVPALQAGAPPNVMEVTSDTPAYCLRLLDQVSNLVHDAPSPPPSDVTRLSAEGQRLCDQGQTRGGIQRLRRALVLLTHPDEPKAQ